MKGECYFLFHKFLLYNFLMLSIKFLIRKYKEIKSSSIFPRSFLLMPPSLPAQAWGPGTASAGSFSQPLFLEIFLPACGLWKPLLFRPCLCFLCPWILLASVFRASGVVLPSQHLQFSPMVPEGVLGQEASWGWVCVASSLTHTLDPRMQIMYMDSLKNKLCKLINSFRVNQKSQNNVCLTKLNDYPIYSNMRLSETILGSSDIVAKTYTNVTYGHSNWNAVISACPQTIKSMETIGFIIVIIDQ